MKNGVLKVGTIASLAMAASAIVPNMVFAQVGDVRQEDRQVDRQQDRRTNRGDTADKFVHINNKRDSRQMS